MDRSFEKVSKRIKVFLTYSELFGSTVPVDKIKKEIGELSQHNALKVLSLLNSLSIESRKELLHRHKALLNPESEFIDAVDIYDNSNILFAVKWFIAFGNNKKICKHHNNPRQFVTDIFDLLLKISDHIDNDIDSNGIDEIYTRIALFDRDNSVDRALLRQFLIFNTYAKDPSLFNPAEFLDINVDFENYYGYSINDYISVLFTSHQRLIKSSITIDDLYKFEKLGIDLNKYFSQMKNSQKSILILNDVMKEPEMLRTEALKSVDNFYDNEYLLSNPILKIDGLGLPLSLQLLNLSLFDGVFFKILSCYSDNQKLVAKFFTFFGRLFEIYVSKLLESSVNESDIPYKFVNEFKFTHQKIKSSDCYLKLNRSLLVIEAKSGRITKQSKVQTSQKTMQKDFTKFIKTPIEQADNALRKIKSSTNFFADVNKVFILSVTYNSFPKSPSFYESFLTKEFTSQLSKEVKIVDQLGLSELECIAYLISIYKKSVFSFIVEKSRYDKFSPYQNFFYYRNGPYYRTLYQESALQNALRSIKSYFGVNS